ncbi:MAG: L-lysine 6-transaminase, partial [Candidatus Asgardarchaeum californiense]
MALNPTEVHKTIGKYMIVDGFDFVYDIKKSKGTRIYDSKNNKYLLDCFSFFATSPLGCNHPKLSNP